MLGFLLNVFLFFIVYQLGRMAGKVEEHMVLHSALNKGQELYDKVIKLAELKGEDTSKFTPEEITRRIQKLQEDTKDQDVPY